MKESLTAKQVLCDIEFELAQGAISQDELGQGIQAVRQFQNKTRAEAFQSGRRTADYREIASRQFQINDMLITLLQETAVKLQSLQLDLRRISGLLPEEPPASTTPVDLAEEEPSRLLSAEHELLSVEAQAEPHDRLPGAVQALASGEHLHVGLEVRPVNAPLVGRLLTRLRAALHSLSLFYVGRLAGQQARANQALAESIQQLSRLLQHQQAQIQALSDQMAALQAPPPEPTDPQ